jgi:hypothetical protein
MTDRWRRRLVRRSNTFITIPAATTAGTEDIQTFMPRRFTEQRLCCDGDGSLRAEACPCDPAVPDPRPTPLTDRSRL